MMWRPRWAIFISGQGSNLSALFDAKGEVEIPLVVSSKPRAAGLPRARRHGAHIHTLPQPADWTQLVKVLNEFQITHIFLLGFMKVIPESFLKLWGKPIYNVHPSLLPKHPGLQSIEKSHAAGDAMGATVHEVNAQVDGGAILRQKQAVPAGAQLSLTAAEDRVHFAEYELIRKTAKAATCWM